MSSPSWAEPGSSSPSINSGAAELYLSLLKCCLTRYGYDDEVEVLPGSPWKRRLWGVVAYALGRRGITAVRHSPAMMGAREQGADWPANAETMIGLRRLDNLQDCVEGVLRDGVPGDLVEAGVWRGGASIFMRAVLAAHQDAARRVWLADSFQGLPKPRLIHDKDAGDLHWIQSFLAVSEEQVRSNFERYGLLDDRVRFLPGWFEDTLPTAPIEHIAVLRADGDMYGSTTDILEALYPKVSIGGFVVIDDYGAVPGCRAAVEAYRRSHDVTEPIEPIDWTGVFWRRKQ